MASRKKTTPPGSRRNTASPKKAPPRESSKNIRAAHEQAEKDIQSDADLSIHSPNDDLDEGETARLGEDKTDMI